MVQIKNITDLFVLVQPPTNSGIGLILAKKRMRTCQEIWKEILQFLE